MVHGQCRNQEHYILNEDSKHELLEQAVRQEGGVDRGSACEGSNYARGQTICEGSNYNFSHRGGAQRAFGRRCEAAQQVRTCEPPCRFYVHSPFRQPERARSVEAERSDKASAESTGARPHWSPLSPAGLEIPRLNRSLVACPSESHGGRGRPDGVCELGGPLLLGPVARMEGTGGGSLGASLHKVKKEGRPFPA
jgi:hypothetical protein